jgi:hypothetical protein
MQRADFVFTIGYEGNAALVDTHAKRRYGNLSVDELLERGLYKPAFCAAVYDEDEAGMQQVLDTYNRLSGGDYRSVDDLKRLFGVFDVPGSVVRTVNL